MTFVLLAGHAFVDIGSGYLIWITTSTEFSRLTDVERLELGRMKLGELGLCDGSGLDSPPSIPERVH